MHGEGTYMFSHGDTYVGGHKRGAKHGKGTFFHANGEKYVGEYKDNQLWNGIYYTKDKKVQGTISNGKWTSK